MVLVEVLLSPGSCGTCLVTDPLPTRSGGSSDVSSVNQDRLLQKKTLPPSPQLRNHSRLRLPRRPPHLLPPHRSSPEGRGDGEGAERGVQWCLFAVWWEVEHTDCHPCGGSDGRMMNPRHRRMRACCWREEGRVAA